MTDPKLPVNTGASHFPQGGRPPVVLDPQDVFRESALHPGRTDSGIAVALGVTIKTFRLACQRDPAVQEAYEQGRAAASNELSSKFWHLAQTSKNPLPMLALANQDPSRGGLGFEQATARHDVSGSVTINVIDGVSSAAPKHIDLDTPIDITPLPTEELET